MGRTERREREKILRKTQILDAARSVLSEKGFESTTIEAIATQCELSIGTIYVYFGSKEEIFAALQEEGIAILKNIIRDAIHTHENAPQQLLKIARAYYRFRIEYAKYFDIMNHFLTSPKVVFPENLKKRIDELGGGVLNMVEQVIAQGIKKGELSHQNTRECVIAFWGLLHGILQFWKIKNTMLGIADFEQLYLSAARDFIGYLHNAVDSRREKLIK